VSDLIEEKEVPEEEVIGEKLSTEYRTKIKFKDSAELRMILYIVPAAIILILVAVVLSKINY
jgi:hypothetical protein